MMIEWIIIDQGKYSVSTEFNRSLEAMSSDYSLKHEDILKRILEFPQSSRLVN